MLVDLRHLVAEPSPFTGQRRRGDPDAVADARRRHVDLRGRGCRAAHAATVQRIPMRSSPSVRRRSMSPRPRPRRADVRHLRGLARACRIAGGARSVGWDEPDADGARGGRTAERERRDAGISDAAWRHAGAWSRVRSRRCSRSRSPSSATRSGAESSQRIQTSSAARSFSGPGRTRSSASCRNSSSLSSTPLTSGGRFPSRPPRRRAEVSR